MNSPPIVLTFAASDPTGGAGLQADILTAASLGCHPLSVLTALTAQDTHGVEGLLAIETRWVEAQARHLLQDMPVAAFKLGVLGSPGNIAAIAAILTEHPQVPVVVDPVLASGRGDALSTEESILALQEKIFPLASIVTPNSVEAARLGGVPGLLRAGARYVLLTGTHEATPEVVNRLHDRNGVVREDRWPRLPGSFHGSGCTLACAIAALLAKGHELPQAVREAQEYTWRTLAAGFRPGRGQALPNRFFPA